MNWYSVLQISPTATAREVKSAYRRLAREHHPDRNPGDAEAAERFKVVAQAYQGLSDPLKRMEHDLAIRAREEAARRRAAQMEALAAARMAWELRRQMAAHPRVDPRTADPSVPGWHAEGPDGRYWQPNPFFGRETRSTFEAGAPYDPQSDWERVRPPTQRTDGLAAVAFDIFELWFGGKKR